MDCLLIVGTVCGEPVEKLLLASASPLTVVSPGPDTMQDSTPDALHDMLELLPDLTRAGFAEIVRV